MESSNLQAELAAVESYLTEVKAREAEMFHWIAEELEAAFEGVR
jgi:hypothetical protein